MDDLEVFLDRVEDFLESLVGRDGVLINQLDEYTVITHERNQLVLVNNKEAETVIFNGELFKIHGGDFVSHVIEALQIEYLDEEIKKC